MPSPNETTALTHLLEFGPCNKVRLGKAMDISTDYAQCLLASLCNRGYVRTAPPSAGTKFTMYELAPKGADDILARLHFIRQRQEAVGRQAVRTAERVDRRIAECEALVKHRLRETEYPRTVETEGCVR